MYTSKNAIHIFEVKVDVQRGPQSLEHKLINNALVLYSLYFHPLLSYGHCP